jgi:hypothetical protein
MKKLLILFAIAALLMGTVGIASATVLTFDELSGSGSLSALNPYRGIINWEPGVWFYYDSYQPPYFPESPPERTFESTSEYHPYWSFVTPVVYEGSYFSGYPTATVQMDLYLGGTLEYSTGTFAPSSTPTFFATGYSGLVNKVVINTPEPDFWVMDNLTYSAIPLPPSVLLLGSGLLGLLGLRRFRKQ